MVRERLAIFQADGNRIIGDYIHESAKRKRSAAAGKTPEVRMERSERLQLAEDRSDQSLHETWNGPDKPG